MNSLFVGVQQVGTGIYVAKVLHTFRVAPKRKRSLSVAKYCQICKNNMYLILNHFWLKYANICTVLEIWLLL